MFDKRNTFFHYLDLPVHSPRHVNAFEPFRLGIRGITSYVFQLTLSYFILFNRNICLFVVWHINEIGTKIFDTVMSVFVILLLPPRGRRRVLVAPCEVVCKTVYFRNHISLCCFQNSGEILTASIFYRDKPFILLMFEKCK